MTWFFRSLRGRLILAVTLTMVATQLIVIFGAVRDLHQLEQAQRGPMAAQHMASALARSGKVPEEVRARLPAPRGMREPPLPHAPFPGAAEKGDRPPFDGPPREKAPRGAPPPGDKDPGGFSRGPEPWQTTISLEAAPLIPAADESSRAWEDGFREALPGLERVIYREDPGFASVGRGRPFTFKAWMRLPDGQYLVAELHDPGKPLSGFDKNPYSDLLMRGLIGLALALLIIHWVVKPLSGLAAAADAIAGDGNAARPVPVQGPVEIAATLAAFERMRLRIHGMVQQRTTMLTALAHDLRTPITRLMLRLELSSDEHLKAKAVRDCEKMQALITSTLDFIRSLDTAGVGDAISVKSAVHAAISGLGAGAAERVEVYGEDVQVRGSRWNLERALANLIDNAVKYGGSAQVNIAESDGHALVAVRDHGPGVPEHLLGRLREPFFRVDEARGVDSGGAGLGLSIVDNLVGAIGGSMRIENHPGGGLLVELRLHKAL
ncbi:MAG: HAMP domain-containing protein [Betaproteobacteria bacterium]|nr:HAMP domain-containing protein [Betaproteobacteria bacterium]